MGGLFDGERGLREITLEETGNYDRLQMGIERIHPRTMDKMINTVDSALSNLKPSEAAQLTWTMCGALLGYDSSEPTRSTNHLWEKAFDAFGNHSKSSNIFVGCLLRWRITILANKTTDNWITMKQISNNLDLDTGEPITRSCYWINNKIAVRKVKSKAELEAPPSSIDMSALASHFGRGLGART